MRVLDHERLDAYRVARELSREAGRLISKARRRPYPGDIISQAYRCISSIPLNIAEGSGEESVGRKAYFYRIARGSATELSAAFDHMADLGLLDEEETRAPKELIVRIVSMLYKLTKAVKTPESFPPLPRASGPRR
jgi:four helix bundle protein